MTPETPARAATRDARTKELLRWLAARAGADPATLDAETPLLERGLLDSLGVVDLLLWLEERRGAPVDVAWIRPGAFRDARSIVDAFLEEPR